MSHPSRDSKLNDSRFSLLRNPLRICSPQLPGNRGFTTIKVKDIRGNRTIKANPANPANPANQVNQANPANQVNQDNRSINSRQATIRARRSRLKRSR